MKKLTSKSLLLLVPSVLLLTASCSSAFSEENVPGQGNGVQNADEGNVSVVIPPKPTEDEKTAKILSSLQRNNHRAHVTYTTRVLHPDSPQAVDLEMVTDETFSYSYTERTDGTIEKGYHEVGTRTARDLEKESLNVDTTPRVYPIQPLTIFEDPKTGLAQSETLNVDNTVTKAYVADYDSNTGIYDPLTFASNFRNPWDYISVSDLTYDEQEDLWYLNLDKAEFLTECYNATSVNWVTECRVYANYADENNPTIARVEFDTSYLDGGSYTRETTMSVNYSDWGKETVKHVVPLTNENPELDEALNCLDDATNFTYIRDLVSEDDNVDKHTTGYYSLDEKMAFYHQEYDEALYTKGDDYDYAAIYQDDNSMGYQDQWLGLNYIAGTTSWSWGTIAVSASALYSIPSWDELIPQFSAVSPAVFTKVTEGNDTYYVPDETLIPSIGSYFDNPFLGVNSSSLENGGTDFKLWLREENGKHVIDKVEAKFNLVSSEYTVTFTLSDIGTTKLPRYFLDSVEGW